MTFNVDAWVDGSVYPTNPGKVSSGSAVLIDKKRSIISVSSTAHSGGRQTNNTGEIQAIINALRLIRTKKPVLLNVYSDSEYALGSVEKIINGRKSFKANADLLDTLKKEIKSKRNVKIKNHHVAGHAGIDLNELAHEFAYCAAVLEVGVFIDKAQSMEEVLDVLKKEQERVKSYKKLSGKATKAGFTKRR
jgi:ribonuclease HI